MQFYEVYQENRVSLSGSFFLRMGAGAILET